MTGIPVWNTFKIALVFGLSFPELMGGHDLCDGLSGVGQTFQSSVMKRTGKRNHARITPDGSTRVDCTAV
jgi:hypothetical protein